ncbi:hypothetical protein CkaCkLH20_09090 [Colletotrichum karsti]|uniref:Uncharacterized protein n=1 Tax=Colletotrichum karsti TaxID=1095194 RepID=A0A9P6I000_9PEZI|nr:uncharacterized protein CkaCkLH20_09090 [Colletotrichum karsti]KAF9873277.1 hypothetical protein CkaCkLH20_09090 [Colletotrichum karsti]
MSADRGPSTTPCVLTRPTILIEENTQGLSTDERNTYFRQLQLAEKEQAILQCDANAKGFHDTIKKNRGLVDKVKSIMKGLDQLEAEPRITGKLATNIQAMTKVGGDMVADLDSDTAVARAQRFAALEGKENNVRSIASYEEHRHSAAPKSSSTPIQTAFEALVFDINGLKADVSKAQEEQKRIRKKYKCIVAAREREIADLKAQLLAVCSSPGKSDESVESGSEEGEIVEKRDTLYKKDSLYTWY